MEITTLQIVLVFIVACIAGMESVLDEFQFHRPLIACTLIGAVLGDMKTGIIIGGTLEMIALGWMNIGAAVAPDAALASIISTVLVIAGHQSIGAGIALAIPLAAAGQVLTIIVRTITVAFQHAADKAAGKRQPDGALLAARFFSVPAGNAYRYPGGYRCHLRRHQRSTGNAKCDS
ncbi:phosphotransferase enzyme II, C component [Salmonella enterica subsp. enterica]|nr:phosphotransferase enzyme II, C component [Salmonella enterica subsp. enterica]